MRNSLVHERARRIPERCHLTHSFADLRALAAQESHGYCMIAFWTGLLRLSGGDLVFAAGLVYSTLLLVGVSFETARWAGAIPP